MLKKLFFSPNFNTNLISVSPLKKQNYKIIFTSINNKASVIIYNNSFDRIYKIDSSNSNTCRIRFTKCNIENKSNINNSKNS